jgi:hypothetical protein
VEKNTEFRQAIQIEDSCGRREGCRLSSSRHGVHSAKVILGHNVGGATAVSGAAASYCSSPEQYRSWTGRRTTEVQSNWDDGELHVTTNQQQQLRCIDSMQELAVPYNNNMADMRVKGYVRRLTPADSRVKAASREALEVHHGVGFGIIPWTGSSREDHPLEKLFGFLWDPGPDCFTSADHLGEFLLEVVLDRRYPIRKEVRWRDELPGSMESMLETAELMWKTPMHQPNHLDDKSSVLEIQPFWSSSPAQRLLHRAVGYLGGDPTAAADDQQIEVGIRIRIHGRDDMEINMRVSSRQERVEPNHEDHHSNERKPIIMVLPIHSILGFLRDSGADCFTSAATFGEIIPEAVTAQNNPKTRQGVQCGMKRILQLGDTDHFADEEWILLQMTLQMTADEIGMRPGDIETIWNKWTPGDDYIHPGDDIQDDNEVTTALREQFGERPEVTISTSSHLISSCVLKTQRWETTRTTNDGTRHPKSRCIMSRSIRHTRS